MSKIEILEKLQFIENFFCIYRSFSTASRKRKAFICARIVIELVVSTLIELKGIYDLITGIFRVNIYMAYIPIIFHILNHSNSVVAIIGGICYSEMYIILQKNINIVHNIYKTNFGYQNSLSRLKIFLTVNTIVFIGLRVVIVSLIIHDLTQVTGITIYGSLKIISVAIFDMTLQFRHLLVFYVFLSVIFIIARLLKCLNESLMTVVKIVDEKNKAPLNMKKLKNVLNITKIKQWFMVYRHVLICSKKLSFCFATQVKLNYL